MDGIFKGSRIRKRDSQVQGFFLVSGPERSFAVFFYNMGNSDICRLTGRPGEYPGVSQLRCIGNTLADQVVVQRNKSGPCSHKTA